MKIVTCTEIEYQDLEDMLRARFPELDKTVIRPPRGLWEQDRVKEDGMIHCAQRWSFVAEEKCKNYSYYAYEIYELEPEEMPDDAHKPLQYSDAESWLNYREGKSHHVPVQYLMCVLCTEGKLPEGTLLVKVNW